MPPKREEGKNRNSTKLEIPQLKPSYDEIAKRAFEIHQQRGAIHGNDLDDWLQAERELLEERRAQPEA